MDAQRPFLDKVQEVCGDVARTTSLEKLYESLIPFLARTCDTSGSALLAAAVRGAPDHSFWVIQGTGRHTGATGPFLRDEQVRNLMEQALGQPPACTPRAPRYSILRIPSAWRCSPIWSRARS